MKHTFLAAIVLALWAFVLAFPVSVSAQTSLIPGYGSGSSSTSDTVPENDLAAAIRAASEAGASVIVIDSAGQVVTTAGGAEAGSAEGGGGANNPMSDGSQLMKAQERFSKFRDSMQSRLEALPYSVFEVQYILRQTSPDGRIQTYVEVLGWNVLFLLLGRWLSIEIYGKRFARRWVVARVKDDPVGYREKMPFLVFRFVMGIGGTIFAMLMALIVGYLFFGEAEDISIQFTVTAIFTAFFLARTVSDLWRMVLSPYLSQYRLPPFSDKNARRLYIWASALATYDISVVLFATWVADFGLNYNVYAMVYGGLTMIGALGNVLMILFNARAISNAIRGGRAGDQVSWLLRVVSYGWAPVLIVYVVFSWFRLAVDLALENPTPIPLIASSYLIFMSVVIAYGAMNYLLERYFDRSRMIDEINEEAAAEDDEIAPAETPEAEQRQQYLLTYEDLARRVAGILAFVIGAYALVVIWYPDADWSQDLPVERALDVMVIIFIGYILFHFFRIWIDSKIAEEVDDGSEAELGDEGGEGGQSRLATLLPLFRGAILAVVVVTIVLIALMELGINVSPLFAGAGVVGLAVGFGSQTLVRDIFSGAFFLLDDAFRKGEYIDIGDVKGTVEKISVRSMQLRHHLGALNTIPFGEIKVLTNYSRDWVIMKLPLRVTYDTDVEKVRKLIKKLGQQLLSDPVIGDNFIQPLKSQGVIEMQDSAMIIRVKFMTKPGDQWLVRKKVYQDIRELFAREGIKFAHREVTVRLADGKEAEDLTPKQREAVTGAVQTAIDEDYLDDIGPGGDDR
ncbi:MULTISPECIES: mechanosensitive ion channel family protein [unclassified Ruegeria]|uniref:mechanosensitive ion channel family protein n=1 Tax=unclassified Ruegeria TaxID=2625375 RepID=UPI0014887EDB|nr:MULTISPECIES: mechanosensitive ion channel family protein [unclassified Ruegeria]NOD62471.1 mechanosensitive ion channel [Ruegeria sp. HKCCD6109]NOD77234.1 mechanosensitive ion channel [Ruegeria sp. HKCCD4332]NOD89705.1 mechanosensitive ion channel [Ruegeria sp. HKCCD4318]NOE14028.1 mechanosensitive ion channel [Ruegeria sp. HKCCD4318-2]NOG08035.1 mechanosensitive ion channel family protein [Ruegeria sp. HKCCD4315]